MVLALFAVATLVSAVSASSLSRKCGVQPAPANPVTLVDGAVVNETPDAVWKVVDPESVFSIEVACWNPKDSTLNRTTGIPAISIFTRLGMQASIKRMLTTVADLQGAHFRLHARYLEQLEPVLLPGRIERMRVELAVSPDGWLARYTVDGLGVTCIVYAGTVPGTPTGVAPREPTCIAVGASSVGS
jgi:hypothetical protein